MVSSPWQHIQSMIKSIINQQDRVGTHQPTVLAHQGKSVLFTRLPTSHSINATRAHLHPRPRASQLQPTVLSEREGEDIREECKHCKRKPPSGAELTQRTRSPLTKPTCFGSLAFKLSSISPPTSIPGMRILLTNTSVNNF